MDVIAATTVFCILLLTLRSHAAQDASVAGVGERFLEEFDALKDNILYEHPDPIGKVYFLESFDSLSEDEFKKRWIVSRAKKDHSDESLAKYDGEWKVETARGGSSPGNRGLVLKTKAKHHAISVKFDHPFEFDGRQFIVQYEVKLQNGMNCGGAYMKLLSSNEDMDLAAFNDKTPFVIMFGPDKCGSNNKVHFILKYKNPITGSLEEKHAKKPSTLTEQYFTDKKTHLYTLVVRADNSFEVYIDQVLFNSGSLLTDLSPPVNPPKEIPDPDDREPENWKQPERIPDPNAVKPADWDESTPLIVDVTAKLPDGWLENEQELIPDPKSKKPPDWDDEIDGQWEPSMINNPACDRAPGCGEWMPPLVKNPKYRGKWIPPMIDNPNYKGKWMPRLIPNPNYYYDSQPYKMPSIGALGLELWSMSNDILFDNFLVTDDKGLADRWANRSWAMKRADELAREPPPEISTLDWLVEAAVERPWLWIIYILCIVIPSLFIIACCCLEGPGSARFHDKAAGRKKTDAVYPDVGAPNGRGSFQGPSTFQSSPSHPRRDGSAAETRKWSMDEPTIDRRRRVAGSGARFDEFRVNRPN